MPNKYIKMYIHKKYLNHKKIIYNFYLFPDSKWTDFQEFCKFCPNVGISRSEDFYKKIGLKNFLRVTGKYL